jgi:molecular chaperone HtpG
MQWDKIMDKDFLKEISTRKIKKEIKNICDSYSNPWDVFAELTQNSIDAIYKWNTLFGGEGDGLFDAEKKKHNITLTLDRNSRSIEILDSGVGFDPETAPTMLAPNNGDKDDDSDLIGEKGVGLTFAIFSSNYFKLESASVKGKYSAEIKNAQIWRDGIDDGQESTPKIQNEQIESIQVLPSNTYTKIRMEGIKTLYDDLELDFFKMSEERIIYYLRTKTAIGSTKMRF